MNATTTQVFGAVALAVLELTAAPRAGAVASTSSVSSPSGLSPSSASAASGPSSVSGVGNPAAGVKASGPRRVVPVTPGRRPGAAEMVKAAESASPSALETLVAAGGSVSAATVRGETPLQAAAARGNRDNVMVLLRHGAPINAPGLRGATALGSAARNGQNDVVRQLLEAGADPDAAANLDHAPLALALTHGNTAAVDLLFEHGSKAAANPELAAAVLRAFAEADDEAVGEAVARRLAPIVQSSPLARQAAAEAIATSGQAAAKILLKNLEGAAREANFQTALLIAAANHGRLDVAASALAHGADIDAADETLGTPLAIAVKNGDPRMTSYLLSAGADMKRAGVDAERLPPVAADVLEERQAARLLARVHALDARDANGRTLLFRASERGDAERVTDLLQLGANASATVRRWKGDGGWTPLMAAAAEGHLAIVARLLVAGAGVDQRNNEGRTALAFAAWYGRSDVASWLMTAGANPNMPDNLGVTPMRLAEGMGDIATVQALRGVTPPPHRFPGAPGKAAQ